MQHLGLLQPLVLQIHLLHRILHAAVIHIAYNIQQIDLHSVEVRRKRRHTAIAILVASQRKTPFVQIAVDIDSETERKEAFQYRHIVSHTTVEALRTRKSHLVLIHSKHEGIHFDPVVPYHGIYIQILYLADILVLEHQQAGYLAEAARILYVKILARDPDQAVKRRGQHVHIRIQLSGKRQVAAQVALEGFQRRHHRIHRREHMDYVVGRHIYQVDVHACRDVGLVLGSIESIHLYLADIALHIHVLQLEHAVTHVDFGGGGVYQQRRVVHPVRFHPDGTA